jgi:hypothetical protein
LSFPPLPPEAVLEPPGPALLEVAPPLEDPTDALAVGSHDPQSLGQDEQSSSARQVASPQPGPWPPPPSDGGEAAPSLQAPSKIETAIATVPSTGRGAFRRKQVSTSPSGGAAQLDCASRLRRNNRSPIHAADVARRSPPVGTIPSIGVAKRNDPFAASEPPRGPAHVREWLLWKASRVLKRVGQ